MFFSFIHEFNKKMIETTSNNQDLFLEKTIETSLRFSSLIQNFLQEKKHLKIV